MSFFLEVPSITYAEALVVDPHLRTPEAALPYIEQALERADAHRNVRQSIPFSLLKAEALAGLGEEDAALAVLAETVRRAAPLGLLRTFADRGHRLAGLLRTLARREGGSAYLGTLLSAFEGSEATAGASTRLDATEPPEPWNVLSNREVHVLELLAERFTNKEVAARLHISPETVKKHALSIYRKLDVRGRRAAVARAVVAGLISARK